MGKEDNFESSQPGDAKTTRIIDLYRSGLSMKEVGLCFGISAQAVDHVLKKAGVKTRHYTRSARLLEARKKKRKTVPKELLVKYYEEEKLPLSKIIEKFNISYALLYKILKSHNIAKRDNKAVRYSPLTEELLRQLYLEENLSAAEIARRLGFAPITVKKRLSKFGIRKGKRKP